MNISVVSVYEQTHWTSIVVIDHIQFAKDSYSRDNLNWTTLESNAIPVAQRRNLTFCQQTHSATTYDNGILRDSTSSTEDLVLDLLECQFRPRGMYGFDICPGYPFDQPRPSLEAFNAANWEDRNGVYWTNGIVPPTIAKTVFATLNTGDKNLDILGENWTPMDLQLFSNNFSQTPDGVATSISNRLRETNSSRLIEGTVKLPVTKIHVNWYWFIYPASMVLLAAIFLIVSIIFSTERGGVVWKSSALPLLLCGLKDYERHDEMVRLRELEREAREIQPGSRSRA